MKEAPENGNIAAWNKFLENFVCVRVMSLEDYNRIAHASWELPDGEVLVAEKEKAGIRLIRNLDGQEYPVEKTVKNETVLSDFKLYDGFVDEMKMETVLLVVPDMERFWENYDASLWEEKTRSGFLGVRCKSERRPGGKKSCLRCYGALGAGGGGAQGRSGLNLL